MTYVAFKMATMDMKYSKEILVLSSIYFLGLIGGGLGLFFGFSYLACFDKSMSLIGTKIKKLLNKKGYNDDCKDEKNDEPILDQEYSA